MKNTVLIVLVVFVAVCFVKAEAADANVCNRGKFTGPCRAAFPRWYWDPNDCQCKKFTYGGCQSNGNNFYTKDDCMKECRTHHCVPGSEPTNVCLRPKHTGRCRAYFRNWYWNTATCKCEQFVYGGCDSNGNNFLTEAACMAKCRDTPCMEWW